MFQRIFLSAILAGLLSGGFVTALHHVTTIPLILEAEKYENGSPEETHKKTTYQSNKNPYLILVHGTDHKDKENGEEADDWSPTDGLERTLYTGLTTILTAIGFALMLTAGFAMTNQSMNGKIGVMWGMAGFAAIALAPAMGLPPELPGSAAGDLVSRQIWWLVTAVTTTAAITLIVFAKNWMLRAVGVLLILVPHAIGTPHPESYASAVPAEIQGHFVAVSIGCNFVFWALLGWFSGTFYKKFSS